ncbi:MAG: hypothetical protein AABX52_03890 [Nanoarchaeota archaeon]
MATIIFGPNWFFGIDSIFELISVITLLLIALYSNKIYNLTKDTKYKTMMSSLLFIASGMLLKILTNLSIYLSIGKAIPTQYIELLYDTGYFLSRYLYIIGLMMMLIILVLHIKEWRIRTLFGIFLLIAILFSYYSYYVFHILSIILLILIVQHFYNNYTTRKTATSRCVFVSFLCLTIAHILFILVEYNRIFYVIAEGIQLFGFLNLLVNYIMIHRR